MKDETRVREEYEKKLSDPVFLIQRLAEITGGFGSSSIGGGTTSGGFESTTSAESESKSEPECEDDGEEIPVEVDVEDDGNLEGKDDETHVPAPRSRSKKR